MSWKGTTKAFGRLPQQIKQKTGFGSSMKDHEFDDVYKKFSELSKYAEKLQVSSSKFRDQLSLMTNHQANLSELLLEIYKPITGLEPSDGAVVRRQKTPASSLKVAEIYSREMSELRETILSELDSLDLRVVDPINDFLTVIKTIKKTITKRDHKKVDYDRYSTNVKKYKDAKDKILSASEEKYLYKQEELLNKATQEYEYYNDALKKELPLFFDYMIQFIEPIFESFYHIQLKIFEKSLNFLEKVVDKSDFDMDSSIVDIYDERVEDAKKQIESLTLLNHDAKLAKLNPETSRVRKQALKKDEQTYTSRELSSSPTSSSSSRSRTSNRHLDQDEDHDDDVNKNNKNKYKNKYSEEEEEAPPAYTPAPSVSALKASFNSMNSSSNSKLFPVNKKTVPPPIPTKPRITYVEALYDYDAQADGDLSFHKGDRIEVLKRTPDTNDWWEGRLHGVVGVFPGNYVSEL